MVPSLSLILPSQSRLAIAQATVQAVASRYEIIVHGPPSATADHGVQWLWQFPEIRDALIAATGDLVAVADHGADLSDLGWLIPWASECPIVRTGAESRGWFGLRRGTTPGIALIRRSELRRLLTNATGRFDVAALTAAAQRAGLAIAAPRPAVAA